MARICLEYESEVQDSQRRPANLLDALEQGNHGTGEDSDFTMGEEKVARFINSHRVCVGGWGEVGCYTIKQKSLNTTFSTCFAFEGKSFVHTVSSIR